MALAQPKKGRTDQPDTSKASPAGSPEDDKRPSYTMVEDRFKKVYFQFYRETYRKTRIDRKTKELIAIAASLGYQCEGCLEGHIKKAIDYGATEEEISEAIAITMGVAAASVVDQTDIAAENLKLLHFP